ERQLLRTGFGQGARRYPQERLVSGRLARERQLLHPLRAAGATTSKASRCVRRVTAARPKELWQRETNVWRGITRLARRPKRLRSEKAAPGPVRGSNGIRSIETARVHHATRRRDDIVSLAVCRARAGARPRLSARCHDSVRLA